MAAQSMWEGPGTFLDLKTGFAILFSVALLPVLTKALYNLYLHPLSRFPGPRSHAISRIPYLYRSIMGTLPLDMLTFHAKYGNVVRIAPDELAFAHADAWKEIQGHKGKDALEMEKARWFYRPLPEDPLHIVNEGREEHGRLRRQMAHGFSERAMREQEGVIRGYVDLLIRRLRELASSSSSSSSPGKPGGGGCGPVVISDWYNYTTFDIIGDLAFGEAFGCLESGEYDGWIKGIFSTVRIGTVLQGLSFYPLLKRICFAMVPQSMKDARETHIRFTKEKMLRRMDRGEDRSDLIEGLLKKKDELGLTIQELIANAEILIIGGSETTATLLSGVTYLLLRSPNAYEMLTEEVRTVFQSEDEINLVSVSQLPYMQACLDEALRVYPPIANGLPRVCPKGGATVMGEFVPENTYVSIHHWALYHRADYFTEPNIYAPERFLGDPKFENDRREVLQPFHTGPRACLGRNLAYSEMRLILALVIFNFDLKLAEECRGWIQQKNFLMWQKPPLKVYLTPVAR
ncbi:cytochrome P450 [Aspergillus pseudoustus]|uniref:Cytochrome P450 n=1 Tax=Aspergillus pseudoustus TaxID=1810923 RepID=A0ABR4KHW2_9EURO